MFIFVMVIYSTRIVANARYRSSFTDMSNLIVLYSVQLDSHSTTRWVDFTIKFNVKKTYFQSIEPLSTTELCLAHKSFFLSV